MWRGASMSLVMENTHKSELEFNPSKTDLKMLEVQSGS
jgi:hypothetical protein